MSERARVLLLLVGAIFAPARLLAHGGGPALIFWGDFGSPAAECQRAIGTATRQCVAQIWQTRLECFQQLLARTPCPDAVFDESLQAARGRARQIIQRVCNDQEVRLLQFGSLAEALVDSRDGCRELDTAIDSATFGPLRRAVLEPADLACVERTADMATPVARRIFLSRERILDRMAGFGLTVARKLELVERSDAEIARAATVAGAIGGECDDTRFEQVFGRSVAAFLETLLSRSDCFAGRCYAQATLVCAAPTCGNGMQEPGETCDDGNTAGGDTCPAGCGIAATTP